ncbi:MAG: DUF2344 domain-containing protein [Phycisphaerales bacterium]|nr:MAG: DUF2344 domain-containing protein [Phycisphaerales bacterium]
MRFSRLLVESEDEDIGGSDRTILVVVKFRVRGNLRYLSHGEMLRVFERSCVRAGVALQYSGGFNPRARLSLPLPKSVGVEGDEELLCVRVRAGETGSGQGGSAGSGFESDVFKERLSSELPGGCEVVSVVVAESNRRFVPVAAGYSIGVREQYLGEALSERVSGLLGSESIKVRRERGVKGARFKDVDVRGYLKSIEVDERGVFVECRVTGEGSIRVEELLMLLGLDVEKLSGPVVRASVEWQE